MDNLNEYLQHLVSTSGQELRLEPNQPPYVVTANGNTNVSNLPLPGTQINTMIFSLIPAEVKQQLPHNSQVEFVHPHNLGEFNFLVRKSPAGFNVTITPNDAAADGAPEEAVPQIERAGAEEPAAPVAPPPAAADPAPAQEEDLVIELNSPPQEKGEFLADQSINNEVLSTADYDRQQASADQQPQQSPPVEVERTAQPAAAPSEPQYDAGFQPQVEQFSAPVPASQPTPAAPVVETPQYQPTPAVETPVVQPTPPQPVPVQETAPPAASAQHVPDPQAKAEMDRLFHRMAEIGSSDLHMSVSVPPMVRKDGKMAQLDESAQPLTAERMRQLLTSIMPAKNIDEFARRNDTDFAYEIPGLARFRANIFMDRKGMGGVFRIIPSDILTAEQLGLSKAIMDLCNLSKGLVVVTGPTGSGKSTTLCAMIDAINKSREDHIITIEDPIEFTHENLQCLVNQREVHNHTDSFKDALRAALREDPDILLVGEMRDLETISIAIETAETGHLVFGTLHTTTAASTVDRIIDQFPADRQQQIRVMLSESLRGVIAQTLLPKVGGGRIAALEVLIVTPAISNLIREGKTFQIPSAMQTGKNKGMVLLNDALMELVNKGLVEPKDAYVKAVDKEGFQMLLQRNGKKI